MSREVPEGWRSVQLGDVIKFEYGKALAADARKTGEIPVFGSSGIVGSHDQAAIEGPSIVVSRKGSLGGVFFIDSGFWPIDTTYYLVRRENCDWQWLKYLLQFSTLERLNEATGVPGLNRDKAAREPILVPPLHEQHGIAEILSSVDDAIAAAGAVVEQTRKVKQGVLERLLTKGIGHTRFKQTDIGEIPEGWEVVDLIDVSEAVTVGIASSATHAYRSSGIPMLRNQNIKAGVLDLSDLLFVSHEYDVENASKRVKAGDVVSMRTGYPGRSAVVPPDLDGCQTFTTLVTKPKRSLLNSDFLCAWINSDGGMKQVRRLQAGGAQQNLNAGVLKKLLVPLPPMPEQKQIALSAQALLFDEEQEISALNELKSALMSDLLTGRKRVTDGLPLAAE
ncbi:restriction endonuclease subunit S [Rhizobium ruizarguesonis]